jgi:hypothetical protein
MCRTSFIGRRCETGTDVVIDFLNIFAKKIGKNNGVFGSKAKLNYSII